MTPQEVAQFWTGAGPDAWFKKDAAFDARCRGFEDAHHAAARGELAAWEESAEGALALCVLLDQIPRNIYRGSAHQFATDGLAQRVAERAIAAGRDQATPFPARIFFYVPLEHAEDLEMQERCVALFEALGNENYLKYAELHYNIIARFGRFPHRNAVLGRRTTAEEQAFLDEGGFKG